MGNVRERNKKLTMRWWSYLVSSNKDKVKKTGNMEGKNTNE
jgi:hypothetical protein